MGTSCHNDSQFANIANTTAVTHKQHHQQQKRCVHPGTTVSLAPCMMHMMHITTQPTQPGVAYPDALDAAAPQAFTEMLFKKCASTPHTTSVGSNRANTAAACCTGTVRDARLTRQYCCTVHDCAEINAQHPDAHTEHVQLCTAATKLRKCRQTTLVVI